jgi:photoactive yellow protein
MTVAIHPQFQDADLLPALQQLTEETFDALPFGAIGFDAEGRVQRYNHTESRLAGLSPERVLGHPLFTVVAPCMNNALVAQRFHAAAAQGQPLDLVIDYVLTLRMRPTRVQLRLLCAPDAALRWVLVLRAA